MLFFVQHKNSEQHHNVDTKQSTSTKKKGRSVASLSSIITYTPCQNALKVRSLPANEDI